MITLQFIQMDDLGSHAIQVFERGWPSHVDVVLGDGTLLGARSDSVGGKPPGVQVRPPDYEAFVRKEVIHLAAAPDVETAFMNFLQAQIGKPYDKTAIVAFAFGRDWQEDDSWFCSELVAAALTAAKWFPQPLANVSNEITPRDLLLMVSPWAMP